MNELNEATIRLFKSLIVDNTLFPKTFLQKENILQKTLPKGFVFSDNILSAYKETELLDIVDNIGLSPEQLNASFHKSWQKIKSASMEQLVMEQLIHYFTTYGFENMGIYHSESVYIPSEKLEIPEIKDKINITIINSISKEELRKRLMTLLSSGIALKEQTLQDVYVIAFYLELSLEEIEKIKNKEAKVMLYQHFDFVPENPVEFLRYIVYIATGKTLLIKSSVLIQEIKNNSNISVGTLLRQYDRKYEIKRLGEIFFRFKPIFLAFRNNFVTKKYINRIRRLANKYHKPMQEDYLNSVTLRIKENSLDYNKLQKELEKVNIFRKIRLFYALNYKNKDNDSIVYRIRNGKSWAKKFCNNLPVKEITESSTIVLNSIIQDLSKNVKGKKIYFPENIRYALPATEKQFTGNFPSGSYVVIPKDMIIGIWWKNICDWKIDLITKIDLDLSLVNIETGKIGWDTSYRNEDRSILFSGDITDAPEGATELFYIQKKLQESFLVCLNFFNYNKNYTVSFKIILAQEKAKKFEENYMVDPNNVVVTVESEIKEKQKILGLLTTTDNECRFYFFESYCGKSNVISNNTEYIVYMRKYLTQFYKNMIDLESVLLQAGAKKSKTRENSDIDLSVEAITKDTILKLLY